MLLVSRYRFVTVDKSSFIGSWYGAILQYDSNYLIHSNITVAILFCCITTGKREWSQTFLPFICLLLELLLVNWSMRTLKSIRETADRRGNCPMLTCSDTPPSSSLICSAEGSSFGVWKMGKKSYSSTILGFNGNNTVWGRGWLKGWFSSYLPYWHQLLLDPEKWFFLIFVLVWNDRFTFFTKVVSISMIAQVTVKIQSATTGLQEAG